MDEQPTNSELKRGVDRVEVTLSSLTDTVNRRFDELGQRFVPREELTSTFASIRDHQQQQDGRLVGLEAGREVDRTAAITRIQVIEERRKVDRFNAKVVTISILMLLVAVLGLVATHLK